MMQQLIQEFTALRHWAVVGFSQQPEKYGNIIYHDLSRAGYQVDPVNPAGGWVTGQRVYTSLSEIPVLPDVVDIVVPPAAAVEVCRECARLGLTRLWLQPGAESKEAIDYCAEEQLGLVHGACAMVEKRRWPDRPSGS